MGKRATDRGVARKSRAGKVGSDAHASHDQNLRKLEGRLLAVEQELIEAKATITNLVNEFQTEISQLKILAQDHGRQLEANAKTTKNVFATLNNGTEREPESGTLRSSLGRMSEEGARPVDRRSLKTPK
ncbi:hypothetical protein [Bradyrhizobium sp. USDA 3650]